MNSNDFRALCVQPDCTLHDALQRMDQTARGILLVLWEDGRLARTLTDGDLRRARLQQLGDELTVAALPEQAALTAVQEGLSRIHPGRPGRTGRPQAARRP